MKMLKYEITVLGQLQEDGPIVLIDRCTLQAKDTPTVAARYAALFATRSLIREREETKEEAGELEH